MAFFTWQPGSRWPMERRKHTHTHTHPSYTFPTHFAVDRLDGSQGLTLFHRTILLLSAKHDPLTYRPNINNSGSIFFFSLGNPTRLQYRIATAAAAASQDAINHRLSVVTSLYKHREEDFRDQLFPVYFVFDAH